MSWTHCIRNERGVALITVLYVALVVAVLSSTAVLLSMTSAMVNRNTDRELSLESVADAGIEVARSRINGTPALYPASGYITLEQDAAVTDASGTPIPNVTRSVYVGPTGITSGQYGVYGSAVSIARDRFGNTVIRRGEIVQESFAKYAYFTDIEPSNISFGGGDQIFGPVHTNDYLKIYSSGATFFGTVETAKTVQGAQYGTFAQGYTEHARRIEMPQTADLVKLKAQAQAGNTAFVGTTSGTSGQATTRIEFVAIDLNGDGEVNGTNEGFIRVYQAPTNPGWVTADLPTDYSTNRMRNSVNCGHFHADTLVSAKTHLTTGGDTWSAALTGSGRRCLLGGSDALFGGFKANDATGPGQWLPWPGAVSGLLAARADKQYLFPITRELNPNFKGVIYVEGKVVLSGVLRGRVTVAATDEIIIGDDLTYATDPGAGTCNDILGLFSGTDVVVADNTINAPQRPTTSTTYYTFDETRDEFIQAVVLALSNFTVENYDQGATTTEPCGTTVHGRGCLFLTGGIIQSTRGAVGTIGSPGGTGYLKRYSYDACAFTDPPPYFPTTGVFARGRYFEVDPVGFNVANYFTLLTPPAN